MKDSNQKKWHTSSCDCSSNSQTACGCSSTSKSSIVCPTCDAYGLKVSQTTIKSQLKKELLDGLKILDEFNFCSNSLCDTVYYNDKIIFNQNDIKAKVTMKNSDLDTPLCYCKKLLKKDFYTMVENKEENIGAKIKAIIRDGKSFCEKSNPKGICCTEDVKEFLQSHNIVWDDENNKSGCC
jgi:hypothetical protein